MQSSEQISKADSSTSSGYVNAKGARLYYEEKGKDLANPVVLIHAGFLDCRMWDEQFALLPDEGYRTIRYDQRGFGKSDIPKEKFSDIEDLADLLNFLDLKEKKVSIIGVSNGGKTAIDFALANPSRVRSLILVAPTVSGYEYSNPQEEKLWTAMEKDWQAHESAIKANKIFEAVDIQVKIWASAAKGETRAKIMQIALDNSHVQIHHPTELQIEPNPPAFKRLSEISVPTLLIWGDKDVAGQITVAERVQGMIPGSKRLLIHGADHIVNLSTPDLFNRVVLKFLAQNISN